MAFRLAVEQTTAKPGVLDTLQTPPKAGVTEATRRNATPELVGPLRVPLTADVSHWINTGVPPRSG
jgi:hypothetical protein